MSRQASPFNIFIAGYLIVAALATFVVYIDIFQHEVLRWDDKPYFNSELVQSLSVDNLVAMLSARHHSNWHPLTTLSFAIDYALWGNNAALSKLLNLILHLANGLMFYWLSFRILLLATPTDAKPGYPNFVSALLQDRYRFAVVSSLIAATLFLIHPQHVESVAWISERKGLLCALFYLAALISYLKANTEPGRYYFPLTLLFTLLALMSKPMAVSLPVAFVLLDIYPLRKVERLDFSLATIKTLLTGKLIYILLTCASIVITLLYQEPQSSAVLGYWPRLINACAAYLHYLSSIFYPFDIAPYYPFQEYSLQPSAGSLLPCLIFAGLIVMVLALYKKEIHFPLIVLAFYIISLLPVIGFIKVGYQAMADRYAYLPTLWIYLLLGIAFYAAFASLRQSRYRIIVVLGTGAITLLLGFTTFEQSKHWRNDIQLWSRSVEVFPDSAAFAYANLAVAHQVTGDMEMSRVGELIYRGLSISPDDPYVLYVAANYSGMIGNETRALEHVLNIIRVDPYDTWAQITAGDLYLHRQDLAGARNFYLAAIEHGAESGEVAYKLASIDFNLKRYADASSWLALLAPADMSEQERALQQQIEDALSTSSGAKQ